MDSSANTTQSNHSIQYNATDVLSVSGGPQISNGSNILGQPQRNHLPCGPSTNMFLPGHGLPSLYNSPNFNSALSNVDASSIQWLTDSRMPNVSSSQLVADKNLSCVVTASNTSQSCCVNRLGMLDSVGLCSPLSTDSYKTICDTGYQTKLPMNMDPLQSWLNLQSMPSYNPQQISNQNWKFMDQNNVVPPQMPVLFDQSDLKQPEACLQMQDHCYDQSVGSKSHVDSTRNSTVKSSQFTMDNKVNHQTEDITKNQSTYQSNIMTREFKQGTYASSPTVYNNSLSDSPEQYLYSQYSLPTSNSYFVHPVDSSYNMTIKSQCVFSQQNGVPVGINKSLIHSIEQNSNKYNDQCGVPNRFENNILSNNKMSNRGEINANKFSPDLPLHLRDCCRTKNTIKSYYKHQASEMYIPEYTHKVTCKSQHAGSARNTNVPFTEANRHLSSERTNQDDSKKSEKLNEGSSSESDESDIIVEESDDTEEIESEISIEEINETAEPDEGGVLLRCLVCNTASSSQFPTTHFIHINDTFPLTFTSQTPVASKLVHILPSELRCHLKLENSFMCRRCLNLVETVEVLEIKLSTAKETLNNSFSKTVEFILLSPVTKCNNSNKLHPDTGVIVLAKENMKEILENSKADPNDQQETIIHNNFVKQESAQTERTKNKVEGERWKRGVADREPADRKHHCTLCNRFFRNRRNLEFHRQLHTKQYSFHCERCGKGFPTRIDLEKHVLIHDSDSRLQCEKCGRVYSQKHRLDVHLLKHTGQFKFSCEECGKGFMYRYSLEAHQKIHTGDNTFICERCGQCFTSNTNLNAHSRLCLRTAEFCCDMCSKKFVWDSQLKKHIQLIHNGTPNYKCDVCHKKYSKRSDLNIHARSHSDAKPFQCKECGKCFKSVGNMNKHKMKHSKEKELKCLECDKSFSRLKFLEDHMNKHKGKNPYKCEHCNKVFSDHRCLVSHIKLHKGPVGLKTCNICGLSVRRLTVHLRKHTGEKPYSCTKCSLSFSVRTTLNRHIKVKHSTKP